MWGNVLWCVCVCLLSSFSGALWCSIQVIVYVIIQLFIMYVVCCCFRMAQVSGINFAKCPLQNLCHIMVELFIKLGHYHNQGNAEA